MLTILGPTAAGKTKLAVNLAHQLKGEILSADSRQVYRGMTIGTGKDLDDFKSVSPPIPYHLIDICDPGEKYNLSRFQLDFSNALKEILERGNQPILCGGSGLYIQAVLENYGYTHIPVNQNIREQSSQLTHNELRALIKNICPSNYAPDLSTHKRSIRALEIATYLNNHPAEVINTTQPEISSELFGIHLDRDVIKKRITTRLRERLKNGLIEEVQHLLNSGITTENLIYYGLEYKFITQMLLGELKHDELFERLNTAIQQFSRRQMTWFRRMEKHGHSINWIDGTLSQDTQIDFILKHLN